MSERALGSRYVLDSVIGSGATGQVWRGRDHDGHPLAFKLLRSELTQDPVVVQRFLQERSLLAGIDDPYVVHVRDLVAEGETLAIVMDLVEGSDLRAFLREHGNLPSAVVAQVGAGIAAGLAAIHRAGVIHRDVKPENVLLAGSSPQHPRLTDFGISKLADSGSSSARSTMMVGTPLYLAPELGDGEPPTPASDLYALGIVLYELACGVTPFVARSALATLRMHSDHAPGRPGGMPDALWEIIAPLLGKDPHARPSSAARVANQLDVLRPELAGIPQAPRLTEPPTAIPLIRDVPTEGWRAGSNAVTESAQRQPVGSYAGAAGGGAAAGGAVTDGAAAVAGPPPRKGNGPRRALAALAAVVVLAGGGYATTQALGKNGDAKAATTQGSSPVSAAPPSSAGTAAGAAALDPAAAVAATASSTPSATPTPTTLAAMPNVVGKALDVAQDALSGAKVTTVDQVDETATDGTVMAQKPAAGTATPGAVTLTVARQPVTTYLDEMGATSGDTNSGTYAVGGKDYAHSLNWETGGYSFDQSVSFNLAKNYRRLEATVGQDDNSAASDAKVLVEVFGDGRKLWSQTVVFGKPTTLDVNVAGVLRLDIKMTAPGASDSWTMVVGNARALGLPGEVPSPTATD